MNPAWNPAFVKSPELPATDRFLAVLSDLGIELKHK
jgi:hypothetical protein